VPRDRQELVSALALVLNAAGIGFHGLVRLHQRPSAEIGQNRLSQDQGAVSSFTSRAACT
jgi:hypothetical protein